MPYPIVLDLETKSTFREAGNDHKKLGVSCVGIYNYADAAFTAFMEDKLNDLFPILEQAALIIGFNIDNFDFPVLDPYYMGSLSGLPTLDLLTDVKNNFGKRLPLDELARETLQVTKSGHGLQAVDYYREGNFTALKKYCLDDVRITRDLYEYGKKHGQLFFRGPRGRQSVRVDWKNKDAQDNNEINLTLGI